MREQSGESNFIKHWVKIRIEGFKPEKLISAAWAKGAVFCDIRRITDTEIELVAAAEGVSILKKLAGSRYKFTTVSEGGSRPFISKVKTAKLLAAGIILFLLAAGSQTFFVKEIDISGMRSIPEESLRQTLREEGLYEGGLKGFDANKIERRLFDEYEEIVWSRVSFEGTFVKVEVRESRQNTNVPLRKDVPCNIVAEEDCYIEEVYPYSGRSVVKPGDFVKKGGILIKGKVPIEHPSYQLEKDEPAYYYVHAAGRVTVRIPCYFSFYLKENQGKEDAETALAQWTKENVPENAQILNKDFHFDVKKNIIRVYGTIETRRQVGIEKEIVIDKHKRRPEKNSD